MAIRNSAKCLALAVLACACTVKEQMNPQAPTSSEPEVSEAAYTPGVVTVEFDDATVARIERQLAAGETLTKASGLAEAIENIDITQLERVFPDAGEYEPLHRQCGMHRFYIVRFDKSQSVTKAKAAMEELPGVLSVTPSHRIHARAFNDPYLSSKQWHMVNTTNSSADIHTQEVWEQYTTGNEKVIVAVMDEGVNYNHEDLKDNIWTGKNGNTTIHGYNAMLHNNTINYTGSYASGHGTHVAGTIAAVNNNGKGVCGVAGGNYAAGVKGVRIMPVPLLAVNDAEAAAYEAEYNVTDAGGEEYIAPRAYTWAAEHGAVISSNSWGYEADGILDGNRDYSVSSEELAYFKSMSLAKNMPALKTAIDYFLTFAGCNPDGTQKADSPMKGGLILFAAGNEGDYGVNYDPFCDYEPIIAVGAFGKNGNASYYSQYGSWVDIAAPGGGQSEYSSDYIYSTMHSSNSKYGTMMGTSQACPHASGVLALIVSYFGGPGFTADDARAILFGGLGSTVGGSKPVGKRLNALGSFQWALANGYTAGGGGSVDPPVVQRPPVVELSQTNITVKAHESVEVGYTASDPDGDPVTVTCEAGSAALKHDASARKLTIDGWKASPGTYKATVTASDGELEGSATLTYVILANHAPYAVGSVGEFILKGLEDGKSFGVDNLFKDDDGETPTITVKADNSCVSVAMMGNRLTVLPGSYGIANVTLTASDFLGTEASINFRVAVVNPDQPVQLAEEVVSSELELRIETAVPTAVKLSVYASTGGLVYKKETLASAFLPIQLNVAGLAPGRYTAELTYNDVTHRVRFVKY